MIEGEAIKYLALRSSDLKGFDARAALLQTSSLMLVEKSDCQREARVAITKRREIENVSLCMLIDKTIRKRAHVELV